MSYRADDTFDSTESQVGHIETGHEGLMRAVLVDALKVYERGFGTKDVVRRKEAREVAAWVAVDDTEWPFSFMNVCACLRIDPDCLRARIHELRSTRGDSSWVAVMDQPYVPSAPRGKRTLLGGSRAA